VTERPDTNNKEISMINNEVKGTNTRSETLKHLIFVAEIVPTWQYLK
jgi:hypothetical protein